ncbi:MAG: hypothetical protein H7178_07185, partial [Chitinophagaceae bacterium]|nr:hypothetical protein [Chitinophagaceae bacterium]
QHVVLSVNEQETSLYLNGKLVAKGAGTKDITTDALDFFSDMNVLIDQVELFDRNLSSKEVERLFNYKKN